MKEYLYYATYQYGKPELTRFEIAKTTKKMYFVKARESILGWGHWARRLSKDDKNVFLDVKDAVDYLVERNTKYIESLNQSIARAIDDTQLLKELKDVV